jgi:ABC-type uncharacterized transport system ATPase subunit
VTDATATTDDPAIIAKDLVVRFRPYVDRRPTLMRAVGRMQHRAREDVIALDSDSFEVPRGQAFGVVGLHGAGKSTH